MGSVIVLSLLIVAMFVVLCYLFNESRIELDSPTIAAMEARAEALRKAASETYPEEANSYRQTAHSKEPARPGAPDVAPAAPLTTYEYREMLEEGGENYVLPQWMVNFFSSSDLCHTLDPSDNVVFIAKLMDVKNAEGADPDISAEPDMSTQTVAFSMCFGQGAAAETLKTKFYLFERGDLFELNRLAHQKDVRIDILTRAPDYTLDYSHTVRARLPQSLLTQLKNVLTKIPV